MGIIGRWVESLDYEFEILKERCVRHKSPLSGCEKCAKACGEEAIVFSDGKPTIDAGRCTDCGDCIPACPIEAIAGILPSKNFDRNKLVAEGKPPTVKELLAYRAKRITEIAAGPSGCDPGWHASVSAADVVLTGLGMEPFRIDAKEETDHFCSRRELFSLWKDEGRTLAKQLAPAKWRFNHSQLNLAELYPGNQFYSVEVDFNACTLCKACAVLCPRKCFTIDSASFNINSQACSGCGLCVDVCMEGAVGVIEEPGVAKNSQVPVYQSTCIDCKTTFLSLSSDLEKCPVCSKRKAGFLKSQSC